MRGGRGGVKRRRERYTQERGKGEDDDQICNIRLITRKSVLKKKYKRELELKRTWEERLSAQS